MVRTVPPRRRGFTLIELLVVISILGLLSALTIAGVSNVRGAQQAKTTDATLTKLQLAMDQQWKAVTDEATDSKFVNTLPATFKTFCDNDPERVRSLYVYLKLKQGLPDTFQEARTSMSVHGVPFTRLATFATTWGATAASSEESANESAALLFLILSEKSTKGVSFNVDDATAGAQTEVTIGGTKFRAFKDAWGSPIGFARFARYDELQQPPYVKQGARFFDPLDPVVKLNQWANAAHKGEAEGYVGTPFDGRNKRVTVFSRGPNKAFEANPTGTTDDHFGYRVIRQGAKGE